VSPRTTTAALTLAPSSIVATGTSVATLTVTDVQPGGTASVPSGSVTVSGTGGAAGGVCALAPTVTPNQASCTVNVTAPSAGTDTITGVYAGSAVHKTASASADLTVVAASTSTGVSFSTGTAVVGQPVVVTAAVSAAPPATASPTGTVSFSSTINTDAFTPASTCPLASTGPGTAGCSVSVTAMSASPHVITASYAGVSGILQTSSGSLTLDVNKRSTGAVVTVSPNPVLAGQPASVTVTVTDTEASGTKSSPAGTVSLSSSGAGDAFAPAASCSLVVGAPGVSSCSVSVSGGAVGARTLSAAYPGSGAHVASGATGPLTINGNTTTTITTDSPAPSLAGQPVAVTFSVLPLAPAVGTPTGTVTVTSGGGASCSTTLPTATCSLTLPSVGTVTLTATYGGDARFSGSSGTRQHTVVAGYTFLGFQTPLVTAGTLASPSNSGTSNLGHAIPIKWQLLDSSGKNVTLLSSTTLLKAVAYLGGACSGQATGGATVLYQPTVGATGGSTFRSSGSGFIFNWDTSSVGAGCYELVLQLDDGSAPRATTVRFQ
ncbi:MAG TPA: Ig-like domain repeat protein, partial [Thermoanaerobaculia bacterium]